MKKWLTGAGVIFLLVIAAIYIFIPSTLVVSTFTSVNCNANAAFRIISEEAFWNKLQTGTDEIYSHRLSGKFYHAIGLALAEAGRENNQTVDSRMNMFPLAQIDSIGLEWNCNIKASRNPIKRILQYKEAKAIKNNMIHTLSVLRSFLEKRENVYGIDVKETMSVDSILVVTKQRSASYPSTAEIYRLIETLRRYIASQGAKEMAHPMLHVGNKKNEEKEFETMVAIPVDKKLKGNGQIFPKRYVPWKIVFGEVRGGPYTAELAMERLQLFVQDHQKQAMGIPFQSLVTERVREPDTIRWITRVVQAVP